MRRNPVVAALAATFCLTVYLHAQQAPAALRPPDRAKVTAAVRDIIDKARYCTLVTIGEDGQPQARIVDAFAPQDDMTVWIGTNPLTRKVAEIRKDPRVTLMYFDTARMSYVTLLGKAAVVNDADEKAKHWKDAWAGMYKDKNRGDDYTLIRVTPVRVEIVSQALGFMNDEKTWRPVAIDLR